MWNMADISVADVIKSSLQQKLLSKCNSILRFTDSNSIWFNPKKRVRFGCTNFVHRLSFLSTKLTLDKKSRYHLENSILKEPE